MIFDALKLLIALNQAITILKCYENKIPILTLPTCWFI